MLHACICGQLIRVWLIATVRMVPKPCAILNQGSPHLMLHIVWGGRVEGVEWTRGQGVEWTGCGVDRVEGGVDEGNYYYYY